MPVTGPLPQGRFRPVWRARCVFRSGLFSPRGSESRPHPLPAPTLIFMDREAGRAGLRPGQPAQAEGLGAGRPRGDWASGAGPGPLLLPLAGSPALPCLGPTPVETRWAGGQVGGQREGQQSKVPGVSLWEQRRGCG